MFYHQVYAQIKDNLVQNIIVCNNYEMANTLARNTYGEDAIAVECTYWACGIGDTYRDNAFYDSDGNARAYKGSEAENIAKLESENTKLNEQVSEDNDSILDLMYENDKLKDQVEEDNDAILDIDYRVSQLEDKEVA